MLQTTEVAVPAGTLRIEYGYDEVNLSGRLTACLNGEPISRERAEDLLSQAQSAQPEAAT